MIKLILLISYTFTISTLNGSIKMDQGKSYIAIDNKTNYVLDIIVPIPYHAPQIAHWVITGRGLAGGAAVFSIGTAYDVKATGKDSKGRSFSVTKHIICANPSTITIVEDSSGVHWL